MEYTPTQREPASFLSAFLSGTVPCSLVLWCHRVTSGGQGQDGLQRRAHAVASVFGSPSKIFP